jgi:predicted dehydrogenase
MAREIGVGLIGYGAIGRMHALCYRMLPLVYPDLPAMPRLVGVATAGPASAERARRELGDIIATTDAGELLRHPDVGLIDCCAPTGDHLRLATAALEAGKLLFCEKPLTASADDSASIATLAREHGLQGGVNYHFRAIPALQEARRLAAAGLIGEVIGFHMRYYRASNLRRDRPVNWRFEGPGSGVLIDLGAHLIDLVLHLLGPSAGGQTARVESDDVAFLEIELADGGHGTIEASKVVPGAGDDLRIEAYGSAGALFFDTRDPNALIVVEGAGAALGGRRIITASRATPPAGLPGPEMPTGVAQWHLASLAVFFAALGGGTAGHADLDSGLRVDRVLTAALVSAASGGANIAIPRL